MSIRREPTYLSSEVWRALWLIAKARTPDEAHGICTPDQMADELLQATIKEKYPQLLEHQARVQKLEREVLKTL
jgi:hypothetical protein